MSPILIPAIAGLVFFGHQHYYFRYFVHHLFLSFPFISAFLESGVFAAFFFWRDQSEMAIMVLWFLLKLLDFKITWMNHGPSCKEGVQVSKASKAGSNTLFKLKFYPSLQLHTISHNFTCSNRPPKIRTHQHDHPHHDLQTDWVALCQSLSILRKLSWCKFCSGIELITLTSGTNSLDCKSNKVNFFCWHLHLFYIFSSLKHILTYF